MKPRRFVVDTSVVMAWHFEDEAGEYADNVLESLEHCEALVPALWPLEVCNVLLVAERLGRSGRESASEFQYLLLNLPIKVQHEEAENLFRAIVPLARQYQLSAYDAAYLSLCLRFGLPLASLDSTLKKAAKKAHVPLYVPDKA